MLNFLDTFSVGVTFTLLSKSGTSHKKKTLSWLDRPKTLFYFGLKIDLYLCYAKKLFLWSEGRC